MSTAFRKRLRQGERLIGTIVTLPCAPIAEMLSRCGFDWLFIDGEHGPLSAGDILPLLQAAQPHCPCVVRVASDADIHIKQALDLGADGIIVPLVNDAATAARVAACAKYPPLGRRSVGIARAHDYGDGFAAYVAEANDRVAVIIQVEHIEAVKHIDAILDVAHIDGVFIGPYDFSASMGKPGQVHDPDVKQQIETVRQACLRHHMAMGIFGVDAVAAKPFLDQGYTLIAVGMDTMLLGQAAKGVLSDLRTSHRQ